MNKALPVLSVVLGFALASRPQSAADLNAKYPVVASYEVRPGILMTPKFTADDQVCQMSIERQRATRSGGMLDSFMSDDLVRGIVDELAPRSEPGEKILRGSDDNAAIVLATKSSTGLCARGW